VLRGHGVYKIQVDWVLARPIKINQLFFCFLRAAQGVNHQVVSLPDNHQQFVD
jgi:hypothetical protein